jgi:hypothetical protein
MREEDIREAQKSLEHAIAKKESNVYPIQRRLTTGRPRYRSATEAGRCSNRIASPSNPLDK